MDPLFRVEVIASTPNPQQVVYAALHQDYSERFAFDELQEAAAHVIPGKASPWADETRAGEVVVKRLLAGERGHYGPLEHVHIVFNVGYFPHSVMQQARTHRVGVSFDVQSLRYTGDRICSAANSELPIEEVFYLRQPGDYTDRKGKRYTYTQEMRGSDMHFCENAAYRYMMMLRLGFAEEHARGILPFDFRQHFVVSFSLRALLHFLDLRAKLDAQEEIRQLCDLLWPHLQEWTPEIAAWYEKSRLGKARLAP